MNSFIQHYLKDIVEYDLSTKFFYKNIKDIPVFEKVILCFHYKNPNYKQILNSILVLNIISNQNNSVLLTLKKSNIVLKLRSGSPVGCKVVLRKIKMLEFLFNFILTILPQDKSFEGVVVNTKLNNTISFDFKSLFIFNSLKNHYILIKDLSNLSVNVTTSSKNLPEFLFLLKSLKFKLI